jgi:hypothetical protein
MRALPVAATSATTMTPSKKETPNPYPPPPPKNRALSLVFVNRSALPCPASQVWPSNTLNVPKWVITLCRVLPFFGFLRTLHPEHPSIQKERSTDTDLQYNHQFPLGKPYSLQTTIEFCNGPLFDMNSRLLLADRNHYLVGSWFTRALFGQNDDDSPGRLSFLVHRSPVNKSSLFHPFLQPPDLGADACPTPK